MLRILSLFVIRDAKYSRSHNIMINVNHKDVYAIETLAILMTKQRKIPNKILNLKSPFCTFNSISQLFFKNL